VTLGLWSRWRKQRHVIRGPRLFTAASGRCGVLQVQPWRPLLEPAQQQMLDRVEANRAQMQRLGDGRLGYCPGQCLISANLRITSELLVIRSELISKTEVGCRRFAGKLSQPWIPVRSIRERLRRRRTYTTSIHTTATTTTRTRTANAMSTRIEFSIVNWPCTL
jgi:hypothetical protein